ncbi:AMP-binding protein [Rudaea sp.]|uniref:AMP-binding protein n=1 Tax=Rudaea sp. TaxID=2136325 RepID=UPI002F954560
MSAVIETGRKYRPAPAIPLLADADLSRTFAWRDGTAISTGEFLAAVEALARRLPNASYAVNLCEDRYRFLVSFCATAIAGQTSLLPASRAPQTVNDMLHAYAPSYALNDGESAASRSFNVAQLHGKMEKYTNTIPLIASDHTLAIAFTSGSTGAPKANRKTWQSFCASSALNRATLEVAGPAPNIVATVPAQHMYGLELSVLLPLRSRAAIHAGQPFFPADIAQALGEIPAPRVLVTTPFHLRALLQENLALPMLAAVVSATAPLDAELAARVERRYATQVIELFGSTETCVIAQRRTAHLVGWSLYDGVELHPQPDGTLATASHFGEPTLLQDIVELLPQRQFQLRGRNSDLLEIAGKRGSLGDLTQRLLAIPGVDDAIVFQLDADTRGVRRLAALAVAPQLDEPGILAALREAIDPVFLPRPLRLVAALPRNATGKLPREALLAALAGKKPVV